MAIPSIDELGGIGPSKLDVILPSIDKRNEAEQIQSRVEEVAVNAQQVQDSAKASLDFLAALAMPLVYVFAFPPLFIILWEWLKENASKIREFPYLALGLPRAFAKTTVVKLFVLYCILFTNKKFILIVSHTATLAENILSDIVDMLEEPNIKRVFGDWKIGIEKDTQSVKKFGFRGRHINLVALGAGGSLRGLNLKNERPDIMIFDDIQSREDADSQTVSEALEKWMYGTAMKAKSPFGCMFLFIGNMYPTKWSLLKKLKKNKNWVKFIVGGILADGTSLWEDLQPVAQLVREYENDVASGHPEIFNAEVLNDENAALNNIIDFSKLPEPNYEEGNIPAGRFIIIDPATQKANADLHAIGYWEIHDTYPMLMEVIEERMSPGEAIRNALEMALRHNCSLIAIESNAYQATLSYWFNFICNQMGLIGIEPVEIYSGTMNKNARILKMLRSYGAGEIFVHPKCRAQVHTQIAQFNPMKNDNTDNVLDLLCYAPKVMEEYGEVILATNMINLQELERATVYSIMENSPF